MYGLSRSKYKFIKINAQIDIGLKDKQMIYKSLIQGHEKDSFLIHVPTYRGSSLKLVKGDIVNLGIFTEKYKIAFETEVLGSVKENGLELYKLAMPRDIKKHERRDFFRVEVALDVKYELLKEKPRNLSDLKDLELCKSALAIDLSGGGIMLKVNKAIPLRKYLLMEFNVGTKGRANYIKVLGQVMRGFTDCTGGIKRELIGVKFCQIDERTRDQIIRFVFEKMLEIIRKT